MVPFFSFYSMFGFQRIGDLLWAAADARCRGFLIGATAGRTTLMGEGLQHQDGHSHLLAASVPACEAYDPAYAYELAAIVQDGLQRMYPPRAADGEDVYYYITVYNENYEQPPRPDHVSDFDITSGVYRWHDGPGGKAHDATILFSGSAQGAARDAQAILAEDYDVSAELWSVTSYKRLRTDALEVERRNRLNPTADPEVPLVTRKLTDSHGPLVAVSDFMSLVPDQVSRFTPRPMHILGTDGFGRSDTREALRQFFEIDAPNITVAVLSALAEEGAIGTDAVEAAIARFGIDPHQPDPSHPDAGAT
jgi:pyruvate dehydrogenase E1 component